MSPGHLWQKVSVLAVKDTRSILPFAAIAWSLWAVGVAAALAARALDINLGSIIDLLPAALGAVGYFGFIKSTVLDVPWDASGYLHGKPVAPAFAFAVKLIILSALLLLPAITAPRHDSLVAFEPAAAGGYAVAALLTVFTAILTRRGIATVILHAVLFKVVVSLISSGRLLAPRYSDAATFLTLNLGLLGAIFVAVQLRRWTTALLVTLPLVTSVGVAAFRLAPR